MSHLEELKTACEACRLCGLCETRRNVVFGDGAKDARVMFVGEGPGEREDETGIPFVGPAGKLLDDLLEAVGIVRSEVYIANIVKCRPPGNRDPSEEEQDACIGYLRRQTALIKPKMIVCLGRIAAKRIISPDFKVTRQHGEMTVRAGTQLIGTFHPSALLREPGLRPEAFSDFKEIARLSLY